MLQDLGSDCLLIFFTLSPFSLDFQKACSNALSICMAVLLSLSPAAVLFISFALNVTKSHNPLAVVNTNFKSSGLSNGTRHAHLSLSFSRSLSSRFDPKSVESILHFLSGFTSFSSFPSNFPNCFFPGIWHWFVPTT